MSKIEQSPSPSVHGPFGSPVMLLLMTGTLVGFSFPLGKIAGGAEVSPIAWAMLLSLGASGLLLPVLLIKRRLHLPDARIARYAVVSGMISFVIPNVLLFSVIPEAGSGYSGLMFAMSPVFTLFLSMLFRLKAPGLMGITGIAVGMTGATIVAITRGATPDAPELIWLLGALMVPIALACGNVYRTVDWPEGASPDALAFWSHGFSVLVYLGLLFWFEGGVPMDQYARVPEAAVAQMVAGGLTFPLFFRLQQRGGPVLLSQLGYVAAGVSLLAATLVMDEVYSLLTWGGAMVIAVGIGITILAQRSRPAPAARATAG